MFCREHISHLFLTRKVGHQEWGQTHSNFISQIFTTPLNASVLPSARIRALLLLKHFISTCGTRVILITLAGCHKFFAFSDHLSVSPPAEEVVALTSFLTSALCVVRWIVSSLNAQNTLQFLGHAGDRENLHCTTDFTSLLTSPFTYPNEGAKKYSLDTHGDTLSLLTRSNNQHGSGCLKRSSQSLGVTHCSTACIQSRNEQTKVGHGALHCANLRVFCALCPGVVRQHTQPDNVRPKDIVYRSTKVCGQLQTYYSSLNPRAEKNARFFSKSTSRS